VADCCGELEQHARISDRDGMRAALPGLRRDVDRAEQAARFLLEEWPT
jgi:hypothetical protein